MTVLLSLRIPRGLRPRRATLLVRNGRGLAVAFLGGTCGRLGDSCGHPELPRRDADEPLEVVDVPDQAVTSQTHRATSQVTARCRPSGEKARLVIWLPCPAR